MCAFSVPSHLHVIEILETRRLVVNVCAADVRLHLAHEETRDEPLHRCPPHLVLDVVHQHLGTSAHESKGYIHQQAQVVEECMLIHDVDE